MKIKHWVRYFIYITIILGLIFLKENINSIQNVYFKREFNVNYLYLFFGTLICFVTGLLLGFEHFYMEIKKEGKWKLNLPKIILMGLPLLYLSLTNIIFYSYKVAFVNIFYYPLIKSNLLMYGTSCVSLTQILLGFVIITSFHKGSD